MSGRPPARTSTPLAAANRAFVRRHTHLGPVPDIPGLRLHLADDVMETMRLAGEHLHQADPPLPFWAFAWAGGLGVARYVLDHPDEVAGRSVVDLAAGSGLCGLVALLCGAAEVQAVDVDPLAEAATMLNASANGVRMGFTRRDVLDGPPPRCDIVLAGDVCYEETMARRMIAWLRRAAAQGTRVLLGDPGRAFLPDGLDRVGSYHVRTSRELESASEREVAVYAIAAGAGAATGAHDAASGSLNGPTATPGAAGAALIPRAQA